MTCTLIVLAHPDPGSFNHAWAGATRTSCQALGHDVLLSDLNAMRFDAVLSSQKDVPLSEDVLAEIDKVRRADRIVFHFPLWWFAPPAILKGWFDRVLAHGELHSSKRRYDTGLCRGKTALFCVTTGATDAESGPDGQEGDVFLHLWPAAYTLRYCGFSVLHPITLHGVHEASAGPRMKHALERQDNVIAGFDNLPKMRFNSDAEFDAEGRLKPDAPSYSLFIRHTREAKDA